MNKNTLEKAKRVQAIVKQWHEPGRQDRSLRWVWKYHVYPTYPMCERTFRRYVAIKEEGEVVEDEQQLKLF